MILSDILNTVKRAVLRKSLVVAFRGIAFEDVLIFSVYYALGRRVELFTALVSAMWVVRAQGLSEGF